MKTVSALEAVDVMSAARSYAEFGWSLIPVGKNKKPAIRKWKQFQVVAADGSQLVEWFDRRDDLGIAVVLGRVSGGLTCRDFDTDKAYHDWAAKHPNLAMKLPTAKTGRGYHVYFKSQLDSTRLFDDGEIRSNGAYVVLPPSRHANGCQYHWLTSPRSDIAEVDPNAFVSCVSLQPHHDTDRTESTLSDLCLSVLSVSSRLIEATLPGGFGVRRCRLFELARRIRRHPQLSKVPLPELKPVIKEWHRLALPHIRTKSFDETWSDFVEAYGNVDPARCEDAAVAAMQRADSRALPIEALRYDSTPVRRFIGLCRELARADPSGDFFLSCHKAAEVLGVTQATTVSRWFKMLEVDGVIALIDKGSPQTMKASRFRWLGRADVE